MSAYLSYILGREARTISVEALFRLWVRNSSRDAPSLTQGSRTSSGDDATVFLGMFSSTVIFGSSEGFQGRYMRAQLK
jgi:hypothetical protein